VRASGSLLWHAPDAHPLVESRLLEDGPSREGKEEIDDIIVCILTFPYLTSLT
jgi:hypothetical protein